MRAVLPKGLSSSSNIIEKLDLIGLSSRFLSVDISGLDFYDRVDIFFFIEDLSSLIPIVLFIL